LEQVLSLKPVPATIKVHKGRDFYEETLMRPKMPGSNIQILPSKQLHPRGIKVCISTLSPESEEKVRTKLPNYFTSGGVFLSASTAQ
jgi:hypothetical protein